MYEQSLYQLVGQLHREQQVCWLGKRSDIRDILPAFDIYVHPSDSEGLPVSLMEAAAAGLPLIGTRVGGIPELIEDGVNGILIEQGNGTQLAAAIELLATNPALRAQYAIAARETAYARFDMNRQTDKLVDTYLCA